VARRRVAIIGLGMAVTPHAKSLLDLGDRVEVAYAFTPSASRREAFAARFPFPLADRLDTVLADPGVDAVLVLTPPNTHLDLVQRAAEAGKHVLLEKPVDITAERARQLITICRRRKVTLGIVLQHRYRPAAIRLRQLLEAGALGRITSASAQIRLWRPQSYYDQPGRGTKARDGGGVLLTQGIHTLDLLISLAGAVEEVMAHALTTPVHRMETEDLATATLRYRNGALGTIEATTAAFPGYPERITLAAEQGHATLEGTALTVAFQDGRRVEMAADESSGGTGADPMAFPHDYHRALLRDFLDALDSGSDPMVDGEAGLRVQVLIEAILRSAATRLPQPID
jgi:UDP-N-acetyl-2-amino-2-deoxyglucuronate dehydrogenase